MEEFSNFLFTKMHKVIIAGAVMDNEAINDRHSRLAEPKLDIVAKYKKISDLSDVTLNIVKEWAERFNKESDPGKIVCEYVNSICTSLGRDAEVFFNEVPPGNNDFKLFKGLLKSFLPMMEKEIERREMKKTSSSTGKRSVSFDEADFEELKKKMKNCKSIEDIEELASKYTYLGDTITNTILRGGYTLLPDEKTKQSMDQDLFVKYVKEIAILRKGIKITNPGDETKKTNSFRKLYRGIESKNFSSILPKLSNKKITKEDCKDLETLKKAINKKKPVFSDLAFLSTSKNVIVAKGFASDGGIVFNITPTKGKLLHGKDMTDVSHFFTEKEVLLKPNQKLQVINASIHDNILSIDVKVIN
jgi:hypothetical protein